MKYLFTKMHGLGNDFVILDQRKQKIKLSKKTIKLIANRHIGIGCDQIIVISAPNNNIADINMKIYNADASIAEACGNASRCIVWLLSKQIDKNNINIETNSRLINGKILEGNIVEVNMGEVKLDSKAIPLNKTIEPSFFCNTIKTTVCPVAVNIGNSHLVFFMDDIKKINLKELGLAFVNHPIFPQGVNVEIAEIISSKVMKVRVWERGVGETSACGTGACASVAAGVTSGITQREVKVILKGGELLIDYKKDNSVSLTGPVNLVFSGQLNSDSFN